MPKFKTNKESLMKIVAGVMAAFVAANIIATISGPICILIGIAVWIALS
jgi:hypothetical protein